MLGLQSVAPDPPSVAGYNISDHIRSVQYRVVMTRYKVYDYTRSVGITLSTMIFNVRTFHCWVQVETDIVEWWFGSDEVHFVPQMCRSLVLPLPLHK